MSKKLYVLHAHDNQYKSTITAVAQFLLYVENKSSLDVLNINNLKRNIEGLKNNKDKRIFHFADNPKKLYGEISGNEGLISNFNKDRLAKEILRKQFVEWTEQQKELFGENVWARKVVSEINKRVKKYDTFWIGDLRFFVEIEEIQKNIDKRLKVEFIYVGVLNQADKDTYYKKNKINTNNFHHKIEIDSSKGYGEIIESIYYQLKEIL